MYKIRGGYLIRQIVGEWVVVALDGDATQSRAFLTLNDAGALLWQSLQRGADEGTLANSLVDAYGIDPAQAAADARAFVGRLVEGGIAKAV